MLETRSLDKLLRVIVREKGDYYVLIKQHDHALASGEFARHWAERPRPRRMIPLQPLQLP